MAELQDYSTTAGSNNSASPAGWPEGMAPSGLNNSDRELAARIARERDDTQGVTATTGSSNAYLFAAARDTAAAYTGELFVIRASFTNTAAATINITPSGGSARGAVAIQNRGVALSGGEIISGGVYVLVYTGSAWQLLNPTAVSDVGTFTAAITCGTSGSVTLTESTLSYNRSGRKVTITGRLIINAISSPVGTMTITGMPYAIVGSAAYQASGAILPKGWAAGLTTSLMLDMISSTNVLVYMRAATGGFTATNVANNLANSCEMDLNLTYFTA